MDIRNITLRVDSDIYDRWIKHLAKLDIKSAGRYSNIVYHNTMIFQNAITEIMEAKDEKNKRGKR